jgi:hypothetical protein
MNYKLRACPIRWQLYANWQHSAPDVREQRLAEYSQHLRECPTCAREMAERREGEANPELSESEIGNA